MPAIARRSIRAPISVFVLAAADDLDGLPVSTPAEIALASVDVTSCQRVVILSMIGTAGTAGIDNIQLSHDGGTTWANDDTLMLVSAADTTGNIVASAELEAAGVEPITTATAVFKSGPYEGPTLMRLCRLTADAQSSGVTWVTGAPEVLAVLIK